MTPVDQQYLKGNPEGIPGDCVRACVASILDLPIEEVPHFVQLHDQEWQLAMIDWCEERGIVATWKQGISRDHWPYMVCGPSPRSGRHACVYQSGALLHDPHPSRDGLGRKSERTFFDPDDMTRKRVELGTDYYVSWTFRLA